MKYAARLFIFIITGLAAFAACKKEYSCENCFLANQAPAAIPGNTNKPPVAKAGPDTTIFLPAVTALLNGGASLDPDNNISTYKWVKISGPASFSMTAAAAVQTTVNDLIAGAYLFELTVKDSAGLFSKDSIQVIVQDASCEVSARLFTNAKLTAVGTLSQKRENMAVGAAGNKIVFAGGLTSPGSAPVASVDIYDIVSKTWSVAALSVPRADIAVTTAGNKIFFGGGYNGDALHPGTYNTVDVYDAVASTWSVIKMSTSAGGRSAAVLNNKVFFAGGYYCDGVPNHSTLPVAVDIYDIQTSTWSTANVAAGRRGIAVAATNDNVYFAGGLSAASAGVNEVDIYTGSTAKWSQTTLSQPAGYMASIVAGDNIYWAGGHSELPARSLNRVEIFNTKTNSRMADCLFQRNEVFTGVLQKSRLVYFTGNSALTGAKNKFDIYDIASNTWSIGLLFDGIQGASIISVNNTIYVAGGYVLGSLTNQLWKLEF